MKLYLSSYKLGNRIEELTKMLSGVSEKAMYISNALDFSLDLERRKKSENSDIEELKKFNLDIENLDLRAYFEKKEELKKKLLPCGLIFVRGGNTFVLRQAMRLSGLDLLLKDMVDRDDFIYCAYSAGACVLAPSLRGLELVDKPDVFPYKENDRTIWEGLGIIDHAFIPHYKSDHPESAAMEKVVKKLISENVPFKVLKDGEVLIINN